MKSYRLICDTFSLILYNVIPNYIQMYRKNNNVYLPSFEKHNKESKVKLMIKKTC